MNFLTWAITFIIAATPYAVTRLVFRLPLTWRRVVDYFPIIAGALYPIARFLPEPHITAESITLVQHFVGGGFVSALYFFFLLYKSRSTRSLLHQFAGLTSLRAVWVLQMSYLNFARQSSASTSSIAAMSGGTC